MLAKIEFDAYCIPQASFTKDVNPRLAKRPLKINGRLANLGLASLVKEPLTIRGLFYYMVYLRSEYE